MYAHLVLFTMGPGNRQTAEEMADKFATIYADCPNCQQVTFLGDDVKGEYGSISTWDSEEALAAYREQAGPQLEAALQGLVQGPPIIRQFEVYEPKI
ncbi:antibiotic biosynthesis monooxygenase family protein [Candidatus Bipolaricaulota bacterium]